MLALVCDDSNFMRKVESNVLMSLGYDICEATNGKELVMIYRERKPDLVLLDIVMNVCDGLNGLRNLKEEFPEAKVIIVSAMGQKPYVIEAIQLGAMDFVVKPFTIDDLRHTILKCTEE